MIPTPARQRPPRNPTTIASISPTSSGRGVNFHLDGDRGLAAGWKDRARDNIEAIRLATEIEASGRKHDLDELITRIAKPSYKMIVLYGKSGVGKSSLVNAGLIPQLEHTSFEGKDVLAIALRTYTNWEEELGNALTPQIPFPRGEGLLSKLREKEAQNFRLVLIFDQFEEFFFVYYNQAAERRQLAARLRIEQRTGLQQLLHQRHGLDDLELDERHCPYHCRIKCILHRPDRAHFDQSRYACDRGSHPVRRWQSARYAESNCTVRW